MARPLRLLAAALLLVLLAGAAWWALRERGPPPILADAATVRVIDGDSLALGERRVRLVGLDAPELAQTCLDDGQQAVPCGRMARAALSRLVEEAGRLRCLPRDTDRFGRVLAVCEAAGGLEINRALVQEGWALAWPDDPAYAAEERQAAAAGRGIHAFAFIPPREWRRGRRA